MLTRILSIPFIIAIAVLLFFIYYYERYSLSINIIPFFLVLAALYLFKYQINWLWYRNHPPRLDKPLLELLENRFGFYANLTPAYKKSFNDRLSLFLYWHEFMGMNMAKIAFDIKALIAIPAIQLSLGREEYLFKQINRIVIYPYLFVSPDHSTKLHCAEYHQSDGTLIFSIENMMESFLNPTKYYNVVLHHWAMALIFQNPEIFESMRKELSWDELNRVSPFDREKIESHIGLEQTDLLPICITLFYTFPSKFQIIYPTLYSKLTAIFNTEKIYSVS